MSVAERAIDAVGKSSILGVFLSEAAEQIGLLVNPDTFQMISSIGVIVLVYNHIVRLRWDRADRKAKRGKWAEHKED